MARYTSTLSPHTYPHHHHDDDHYHDDNHQHYHDDDYFCHDDDNCSDHIHDKYDHRIYYQNKKLNLFKIISKSQNFAADTGLATVTFPETKVMKNCMIITMMIFGHDQKGL